LATRCGRIDQPFARGVYSRSRSIVRRTRRRFISVPNPWSDAFRTDTVLGLTCTSGALRRRRTAASSRGLSVSQRGIALQAQTHGPLVSRNEIFRPLSMCATAPNPSKERGMICGLGVTWVLCFLLTPRSAWPGFFFFTGKRRPGLIFVRFAAGLTYPSPHAAHAAHAAAAWACAFFLFPRCSATVTSVGAQQAATEAAFCRAVRATLVRVDTRPISTDRRRFQSGRFEAEVAPLPSATLFHHPRGLFARLWRRSAQRLFQGAAPILMPASLSGLSPLSCRAPPWRGCRPRRRPGNRFPPRRRARRVQLVFDARLFFSFHFDFGSRAHLVPGQPPRELGHPSCSFSLS